ncbi:MAG TPA: ABC transporter permease [Acidobacteriota bacterium]|nr:ABC transporter permease [Acidobacteriota bacterium]
MNFRSFASDYGMLAVLILLCAYFSWATLQEQPPRGEAAAQALADVLAEEAPANASIAILSKSNPDGTRFAQRLQERLESAGLTVTAALQGDPPSVRTRLRELTAQGTEIDILATTADYRLLAESLVEAQPELSQADVRLPPASRWPTFLLTENLLNVANQIVVIAVIAIGMTMVIITGGIDLSVGSLIALSAVAATWLIRWAGAAEASASEMVLASLGGILLSAGLGLFSGVMVTAVRIPSFIATLAMMQVASGLAFIISGGLPIYQVPDTYTALGRGQLFSIPIAVILMAILYLLAHLLMSHTRLGRYIYAVGGNAEAARLSGVRVQRIRLFVFAVSGAMAGLGGIVLASQLKSGSPTYGLTYELYVIAAVVVGGASLSGGRGKIFGTLIGALIIAVINNGMNLTNVESYTQKVVLGFVVLGAVVLDSIRKRAWKN